MPLARVVPVAGRLVRGQIEVAAASSTSGAPTAANDVVLDVQGVVTIRSVVLVSQAAEGRAHVSGPGSVARRNG